MTPTDLIARLRQLNLAAADDAADALTAAKERIEALEGAVADALGRYQITHVHEGLRAALDATGKGEE